MFHALRSWDRITLLYHMEGKLKWVIMLCSLPKGQGERMLYVPVNQEEKSNCLPELKRVWHCSCITHKRTQVAKSNCLHIQSTISSARNLCIIIYLLKIMKIRKSLYGFPETVSREKPHALESRLLILKTLSSLQRWYSSVNRRHCLRNQQPPHSTPDLYKTIRNKNIP